VEREQAYRIIEARNLVSLANNSRWSSLFAKLLNERIPARLKHIAWSEMSKWSVWLIPVPRYLEVVAAGPVHFREIEWVDFHCGDAGVECDLCSVAAREAKLTSQVVGQAVRVFGYRCC